MADIQHRNIYISRRSQDFCTYAELVGNLTNFASHGTVIAIALNRFLGAHRVTRLNKKVLMTPTEASGLCVLIWILVLALVIPTTFYKGTFIFVLHISIAISSTLVIGSYFFLGILVKYESDKFKEDSFNETPLDVFKVPSSLFVFIFTYLVFTVLPTIGLSPMSSQHSSLGIGFLTLTKQEGVDFFSVLCCNSW